MKIFFITFILSVFCINCPAQINNDEEPKPSFRDTLYNYKVQLEKYISDDWYIEIKDSSLVLHFCRSCQKEIERIEDSLFFEYLRLNPFLVDTLPKHTMDSLYGRWHQFTYPNRIFPFYLNKKIFTKNGPDSISVNSYNSRLGNPTLSYRKKLYKPTQTLSIEIIFSKKWTEKMLKEIQNKNDKLKHEIQKESLGKTVTSFDDYRAFIPQPYLKSRTKKYDYYFERLPYDSELTKHSVFIISNSDELNQEYILYDKNDAFFYIRDKNNLDKIRRETFILIGYALQLKDYKYIGQ